MKTIQLTMKTIFSVMLLALCCISCSDKDEENDFNYPLESLYGTWQIQQYKMSESASYATWVLEKTTATFKADGTYSGSGYFGNGTGTYEANGNTITTYVSGKQYITYSVITLNGNTAELKLSTPDSDKYIWIKCSKK